MIVESVGKFREDALVTMGAVLMADRKIPPTCTVMRTTLNARTPPQGFSAICWVASCTTTEQAAAGTIFHVDTLGTAN